MPSSPPVCDRIEVRHSAIHGRGVFATRSLPSGTHIGRYTGRRYSAAEAAERDWDNDITYAFGLSDGTTIDGGDGGNATCHLNHSCRPNCVAHELADEDGSLHIEIRTTRRIQVGEELFIDYGLQTEGDAADYPCRCGTPRCRGSMVAAAPA
jgi:uncharacterized protein